MSSDGYLQHAATAEAWARQSANAGERDAYLEIAALWRALATRKAETAAVPAEDPFDGATPSGTGGSAA